MSDELRGRLEQAAGPAPDPLDFDHVVSRARRQTTTRAATTIAATVGAVLLAASLATSSPPEPPSIVDQPPPGPTASETTRETAPPVHDVGAGLTLGATLVQKLAGTPEPTWYSAGAVVRNQAEDATVVAATLTPYHQDGRSGTPLTVDPVTIPPGEDGLLFAGPEDIGLDLEHTGRLQVEAEVVERIADPVPPAVTVSEVGYETGAGDQCVTSGRVTNSSGVDLIGVQVAMLGYVDGELRTATAQSVPDLPAATEDSFSLPMSGASACPDELDDVRVLLDLPAEALTAPAG